MIESAQLPGHDHSPNQVRSGQDNRKADHGKQDEVLHGALRSGNGLQGRCRLQQAAPVHDTEPVANLGDNGVNSADHAAPRSAYLGLHRLRPRGDRVAAGL